MKIVKTGNQRPTVKHKFAKIIIGVLCFGVLMGIRGEFAGTWLRALIAGVAGGFFGWMMVTIHKRSI